MAVAPSTLFDSNGSLVRFGRRLGAGGEGAVYEIAGSNDLVAKVYHKALPQLKQDKLIGMVRGCDDTLKKVAAWPTSTLHQGKGGKVCGFIMPRISGFEAIHKLYSPAHRKQFFQTANWAFLVNAARNAAAVFEIMHASGHVIGDVNYGNVLVARNTVVKLIDCDSFQITVWGRPHLCEVGVAHFTPPELQVLKSFHGTVRTENHDNFGLALLCFHLLFMGRHPFSGIYSGKEDMPIERAIREFRFAFGRNALSKGMKPPPNSLDMNMLTPSLSAYFEQAFSEAGVKTNRPKAKEWVQALEDVKKRIRTCQAEPAHKFVDGTGSCPWCALEQKSGVLFFIRTLIVQGTTTAFDLVRFWERILSVAPPGTPPVIDLNSFKATPTPLPTNLRSLKRNQIIKRILAVVIVVGVFLAEPKSAIIYIVAIIAGLILFFSKAEDSPEKKARNSARNLAESKWIEAEKHWKREAGDGGFEKKLGELRDLKKQYEGLNVEYSGEKQKLQSEVKQRQLHKFLDGFFIERYAIKGIGAARKAVLASFGIETAADVDYGKIIQISGFGQSLTSELVNWRKGLEGKFVFNPSRGIDPADIAALDQKFRQVRRQIEGSLLAGEEELKRVRNDTHMRRQALRPQIEAAAQAYIQAIADESAFSLEKDGKRTPYVLVGIAVLILCISSLIRRELGPVERQNAMHKLPALDESRKRAVPEEPRKQIETPDIPKKQIETPDISKSNVSTTQSKADMESPKKKDPPPLASKMASKTSMDKYYGLIKSKIRHQCALVGAFDQEESNLETIIVIVLTRDGVIQKSWYEKSSGNPVYDDAVMQAIKKAEPFPPFPEQAAESTLEIGLRFAK